MIRRYKVVGLLPHPLLRDHHFIELVDVNAFVNSVESETEYRSYYSSSYIMVVLFTTDTVSCSRVQLRPLGFHQLLVAEQRSALVRHHGRGR